MNSIYFGFFGILAVIYFSLQGEWSFYVQEHSMLIVLGGTAMVLLFTSPFEILKNLFVSILDMMTSPLTLEDHKNELIELSKTKKIMANSKNPLIQYAAELWEQGVDSDLFVVLVSQMKDDLIHKKTDAVHSLKNLAKYPPALGMTGTVMGMVALFAELDSQKNNVGENLALAMTATFFGLILANGLIAPLADRLNVNQVYYQRYYTSIYQVLMLINAGEPTAIVTEEVENRAA